MILRNNASQQVATDNTGQTKTTLAAWRGAGKRVEWEWGRGADRATDDKGNGGRRQRVVIGHGEDGDMQAQCAQTTSPAHTEERTLDSERSSSTRERRARHARDARTCRSDGSMRRNEGLYTMCGWR